MAINRDDRIDYLLETAATLSAQLNHLASDLRTLAKDVDVLNSRVDTLEREQMRKASIAQFFGRVLTSGWPVVVTLTTGVFLVFWEVHERLLKGAGHA